MTDTFFTIQTPSTAGNRWCVPALLHRHQGVVAVDRVVSAALINRTARAQICAGSVPLLLWDGLIASASPRACVIHSRSPTGLRLIYLIVCAATHLQALIIDRPGRPDRRELVLFGNIERTVLTGELRRSSTSSLCRLGC